MTFMKFIRAILRSFFFFELCTNVLALSKMVLANAIAFVVLKILHNLVFMQKSLLANNCLHKQNHGKSLG